MSMMILLESVIVESSAITALDGNDDTLLVSISYTTTLSQLKPVVTATKWTGEQLSLNWIGSS